MIPIAVVAPVDRFDQSTFYKGSIWIKRSRKTSRLCLQGLSPRAVKLELSALFERFMGKSIEPMIICPKHANKAIVSAISEMLPGAPIHVTERSYKFFCRNRNADGATAAPFRLELRGVALKNYRPHWYEEPEPPILLRSIQGAPYTYPSTDGFEDDTNQVTEK